MLNHRERKSVTPAKTATPNMLDVISVGIPSHSHEDLEASVRTNAQSNASIDTNFTSVTSQTPSMERLQRHDSHGLNAKAPSYSPAHLESASHQITAEHLNSAFFPWTESRERLDLPKAATNASMYATDVEPTVILNHLLAPHVHSVRDQYNPRTRYYTPNMNLNLFSNMTPNIASTVAWEQKKRVSRILDDIPTSTQDLLMGLFFTRYNLIMHVTNQEDFYRCRGTSGSQFYSGFLHICMLAMGFRLTDTNRANMQQLTLSRMESTLHREAKDLVDYELEHSQGLPTVQALLILSDLEFGLGRETTGWMYTGAYVSPIVKA